MPSHRTRRRTSRGRRRRSGASSRCSVPHFFCTPLRDNTPRRCHRAVRPRTAPPCPCGRPAGRRRVAAGDRLDDLVHLWGLANDDPRILRTDERPRRTRRRRPAPRAPRPSALALSPSPRTHAPPLPERVGALQPLARLVAAPAGAQNSDARRGGGGHRGARVSSAAWRPPPHRARRPLPHAGQHLDPGRAPRGCRRRPSARDAGRCGEGPPPPRSRPPPPTVRRTSEPLELGGGGATAPPSPRWRRRSSSRADAVARRGGRHRVRSRRRLRGRARGVPPYPAPSARTTLPL